MMTKGTRIQIHPDCTKHDMGGRTGTVLLGPPIDRHGWVTFWPDGWTRTVTVKDVYAMEIQ